ncbi:MAG TPA: hypothetical protein VKJ77_02795 [Caballeronia sp.]|nr:hypothetical protein [Caballeronia sp.]
MATLDARPLEGFIGSGLDVILRPILTKRLQRSAERPDSLYATRGRLRFDCSVTVMFFATARTVPGASSSKPGRVKHVERAGNLLERVPGTVAGTCHIADVRVDSFSSLVSLSFSMLPSFHDYL